MSEPRRPAPPFAPKSSDTAASGAICVCGCADPLGAHAHALARMLARDDLDGAIEHGLLRPDFDTAMVCAHCTTACARTLSDARDARVRALAARERYRARAQRLQRRSDERAAQRAPAAGNPDDPGSTPPAADAPPPRPALPNAAAAALARAKAKAAQRGPT